MILIIDNAPRQTNRDAMNVARLMFKRAEENHSLKRTRESEELYLMTRTELRECIMQVLHEIQRRQQP